MRETSRRSGADTFKLVASWLVVLIPAAWGVSQVVAKAAALFK
ncbi:MAG TPA: hypothetical protein VE967_00480 [Gemmatimonadaceae bacterium]|nr:hypothetical protein [Gemmatimonadaceae bacterium]